MAVVPRRSRVKSSVIQWCESTGTGTQKENTLLQDVTLRPTRSPAVFMTCITQQEHTESDCVHIVTKKSDIRLSVEHGAECLGALLSWLALTEEPRGSLQRAPSKVNLRKQIGEISRESVQNG